MKTVSLLILCLNLLSCNLNPLKADIKNHRSTADTRSSTMDFFSACDALRSWQGGIQGVEVSDSTKGFPMAECHTNNSYDLIWVPKGDILKSAELVDYTTARKTNFKDFDCYAFVIPKTNPRPEEGDCDCGEDEYEYVFPSSVTVYKKVNNDWIKITTQTVKSFEQLGRLKLNTIFKKLRESA